MIGDGINDSPALSCADAGVAISDGAEIARELADVIIGADDLEQIERRGLLTTLARACASLGINAITAPVLKGADTLRSYGIQLLPPTDRLAQQPPSVGGGWRGPSPERGQHFLTDSYLDRWHFYLAGRRAWNSSISTEQIAFE